MFVLCENKDISDDEFDSPMVADLFTDRTPKDVRDLILRMFRCEPDERLTTKEVLDNPALNTQSEYTAWMTISILLAKNVTMRESLTCRFIAFFRRLSSHRRYRAGDSHFLKHPLRIGDHLGLFGGTRSYA
jgi:serine/threonine protein kinase